MTNDSRLNFSWSPCAVNLNLAQLVDSAACAHAGSQKPNRCAASRLLHVSFFHIKNFYYLCMTAGPRVCRGPPGIPCGSAPAPIVMHLDFAFYIAVHLEGETWHICQRSPAMQIEITGFSVPPRGLFYSLRAVSLRAATTSRDRRSIARPPSPA